MRSSIAPLVLAIMLPACSSGPADSARAPHEQTATATASHAGQRLHELVSYMSGAFDSAEQAATDRDYFNIHLHMVPIWSERDDGKWLYVEQAMAERLDKPYRQRVYRVSAVGGDLYKSEVFELPGNPLDFAGYWQTPAAFSALSPESLVPREGCAITLKDTGKGFVGGTHEQDCASSLRGAAYATSEVSLGPQTLISWDRGFDANGVQVWGATKGGYVFRKPAQ